MKKIFVSLMFSVLFVVFLPLCADAADLISDSNPGAGENNVPVDKIIKIKFAQEMDADTIDELSVLLIEEATQKELQLSVNYNDSTRILTIFPVNEMQQGTIYKVILTSNIKMDDGENIDEYAYNFRTKEEETPVSEQNLDKTDDIADVYIVDMKPLNNETDVAIDKPVVFSFSDQMDITTINSENVQIFKSSGEQLECQVSYDYPTCKVTVKPIAGFDYNSVYKVKVSNDVLSIDGRHFAWVEWKFATETSSAKEVQHGTMYNPLVTFNGKLVSFSEARPYIKNKRAMVPMRALFELLNAQMTWNNDQQKITAILNDSMIELFIGKKTALKNGKAIVLDAAPEISKNYTMIPLRFAAESLGVKIKWDSRNYIIDLSQ